MSVTLSPEEVQALAGGYSQPGKQLAELKRLGFYRARLGKVTGKVILERAHVDAVAATTKTDGQAHHPQVRAPKLRAVT